MPSPTAGPLRVLRAGVLACAVLGLSISAHLVAGGTAPGWPLLLVLAAVVGSGCTFLTRRRLSPQALLGVMAASQLVLHEALMLPARLGLAAAQVGPPMTHCTDCMAGMPGMAGAQMTGMSDMPGMGEVPGIAGMPGDAHGMSVTMLLCHVLVALLLAGVLAYGEALLWQLWCWLTPAALRFERREGVVRCRAVLHPGRTAVVPATLVLLEGDPRRGPPPACASAR